MSGHEVPDSLTLEDIVTILHARGAKVSASRRVIAATLLDAGSHFTAEELATRVHAEHPEIHMSTVYRTLDLFEELGISYHVHLGHGPARWHTAGRPHVHLNCDRCGAVVETEISNFRSVTAALRKYTGFTLDVRHFALSGTCASCADS